MSVQLLGKRELKRLGSVANDGAGAGYTNFAKGMMAKMGWAEGQGLGKDMQGRSTYVQVKKKDDNAGLGKERAQQNTVNDQWYFNAFDSALQKMGGKKKKSKKRKGQKDNEKGDENKEGQNADCMYTKMFKATGGSRMGMRARASQNGKLARTEGGTDGEAGVDETPVQLDEGGENVAVEARANTTAEMEQVSAKLKVKVKAEKIEDAVGEQKEEGVAVETGKKRKRKRKDVVDQDVANDRKSDRKQEKADAKKAKQAKKARKKEAKAAEDDGNARAQQAGKGEGEKKRKKKKRKEG